MNIITIIKDKDIGFKIKELNNSDLRIAARGIIFNYENKIAIINKTNKNEYKLPGGGIEENEDIEDAFKREVLEETGCEIEIINNLGITEEYKSNMNSKQISYVFVAKVNKDTKSLNYTQKEIAEGSRLLWLNFDEGLKLVKESFDKIDCSKFEDIYNTKFVVLRDRKILEYYKTKYIDKI